MDFLGHIFCVILQLNTSANVKAVSMVRAKSCLVLVMWVILKLIESKKSLANVVSYSKEKKFLNQSEVLPRRKPVVIVPGILGSKLMARLNKPKSLRLCEKQSDWFTLWLDAKLLFPDAVNCWIDNMRLVYNSSSSTVANSPGVEIKVSHFGSTLPFENLDSCNRNLGQYFAPLVQFLVGLGYKRNIDLLGAAYDWRLSPQQHSRLFKNIKSLIEKAYFTNGKKVVIMSHSMGSPFANHFLTRQSLQWKSKFVDSFVSISGSFLGSIKAVKSLVSGDAEGYSWLVNERKMRRLARTLPSFFYMLPKPGIWPKNKETLVVTPWRNYTVYDYDSLFKDTKCKWCHNKWRDNTLKLNDYVAPSVPVHCIYSSGIPTYQSLVYDSNFPNSHPKAINGDGDGTINIWSGSACVHWKDEQKESVYDVNLSHNAHVNILWNATLHRYLEKILMD